MFENFCKIQNLYLTAIKGSYNVFKKRKIIIFNCIEVHKYFLSKVLVHPDIIFSSPII